MTRDKPREVRTECRTRCVNNTLFRTTDIGHDRSVGNRGGDRREYFRGSAERARDHHDIGACHRTCRIESVFIDDAQIHGAFEVTRTAPATDDRCDGIRLAKAPRE
jgi:hypothetical protein